MNFIVWDPVPEIFYNLETGLFSNVRWYGLLFAMGFIIGQQIMFNVFKKEGKPEQNVEELTVYMVVATIIGARLGHVIFYELIFDPTPYLKDPLKVFKIWEGGLASHGGAAGIILALYIYRYYKIRLKVFPPKLSIKKEKRQGQSLFWVLDRIVIVVALGGAFIRMGNFVNSEIIGLPTDSQNGVVFARNVEKVLEGQFANVLEDVEASKGQWQDSTLGTNYVPVTLTITFKPVGQQVTEATIKDYIENNIWGSMRKNETIGEHVAIGANQPAQYVLNKQRGRYIAVLNVPGIARHPAQMYEAISCLLLFFFLWWLWSLKKEKTREGLLFGVFLIVVFGLRVVYEAYKENQVPFEEYLPLNMGQILSLPLLLAGIVVLAVVYTRKSPAEVSAYPKS